jgi:hypothetical protein
MLLSGKPLEEIGKPPRDSEIIVEPEVGIRIYLFKVTTVTLFTPLHARYKRPSGVATILRTTPPPDGIAFIVKFSDLGSN